MSKKNKPSKQCGTVKILWIIPFVGVIAFVLFFLLLIASIIFADDILLTCLSIIFCVISVLMILTFNQRIDYTPKGFLYQNLFRHKHYYTYSQITKIRYSKDIKIYIGRKIILIDSMAVNGKKFARIASQYSNVKFTTDSQSKLFNGKVANPGEFIFVYIVIALIPICLLIFNLYEFHETELSELTAENYIISDYYFDNEDDESKCIKLKFENNKKTFYSWYTDNIFSKYESFQNDADNKKEFTVFYSQNDKTSNGECEIYQLSCDKSIYIDIEDYNENIRELRKTLIFISSGSLLFWILYVIVSSYVMCNAEKYPRLIKLFVKETHLLK